MARSTAALATPAHARTELGARRRSAAVLVVHCDVPIEMTLAEYRRTLAGGRPVPWHRRWRRKAVAAG